MPTTSLQAYGIKASLPAGFDGRIFRRAQGAVGVTRPVAHFATVPLPADAADFGGGVVTRLGPDDMFVSLFEYGPESVGTALFARRGMPRALRAADFRPYTLRRGLGGQSGTQWFFTEGGRPFTLYAVLGSHGRRGVLVPRLNALLADIRVQPGPAGAVPGRPG
jgi:hypothetical protein